jgi:hypothetical protein
LAASIDLSGLSVTLAMPVRDMRDITIPTMMSLIGTIQELNAYGIPYHVHVTLGDLIDHARSKAVERFLKTDSNRLFFFDSDIVWHKEDSIKVLAYSVEHEVIGAAYRAKKDPPFYLWHPGDNLNANVRGCIPVSGMGLGFTCIQRTVLEQLSAKAPVRSHTLHPEPFPDVFRFDRIGPAGDLRGEDFTFFQDVRDLGYTPMMDPSIELGHVGMKEFWGRISDVLVRADAAAA